MHVTNAADAMILSRLFTALLDEGVAVVTTSNRPPRDLYKDGLNRELFLPFIDLLEHKLEVVSVNGPTDYRLDRLAGVETWHVPNGPQATAALSQAFFQLTDYPVEDRAKVPSEELDVGGGRTLHVPKSLKGVAVFSFKRLCGEPRGAADYLAIARRFHTVIIVGIPVMGKEMRNEAARFVTLIDALYEHKVKLLAAADAEPAGLYPAGDGGFEFAAHRQPPRGNAQRRLPCRGPWRRLASGSCFGGNSCAFSLSACSPACPPPPWPRPIPSAAEQARSGMAGEDPRLVRAGDRDPDGASTAARCRRWPS